MRGLATRVAVVTGAGGGIGEAIVRRLAEEGVRVALADVDLAAAATVAARVPTGDLWPMQVDVTSENDLAHMVAELCRRWERIDILVNNAGRTRVGPFLSSHEEHWEELFRIDVFGVLRASRAVLPIMQAQHWGRIINIASDAARVGLAGQAVYAAAKGAVLAFTKSLAREVAADGVLVNAVSPGPVNTPPLRRLLERQPELARQLEREIPLGRVAEPDEVAATVAFLASDDACYLTGQVISVNGGWVML